MNIVDEINTRILERNITMGNLDILCSPRSISTKYTLPSDINNINSQQININKYNFSYNIEDSFNPGNTKGSWSGFIKNINNESVLRNQVYALQKFPQSEYIPKSTSDMYVNSIPPKDNNNAEVLFPNLFNHTISTNNTNNKYFGNIGNNLFNNYTRQQLKDN